MRSEQVCWVFTVTVDQMDKFKPLIPKLVAATAVANLVAGVVERQPDAAFDPAFLSEQS